MHNFSESVAVYEVSYSDENKHFAYIFAPWHRISDLRVCESAATMGYMFEDQRGVF